MAAVTVTVMVTVTHGSEHGARPRFRPHSGRSWGKAGLIPAGGLFQQGPAPLPLLPARWPSPSGRASRRGREEGGVEARPPAAPAASPTDAATCLKGILSIRAEISQITDHL